MKEPILSREEVERIWDNTDTGNCKTLGEIRNCFASAVEDAVLERLRKDPAAWRIFDGEGGYSYTDSVPTFFSVEWAAKYGRKYEALYTLKDRQS